jgi:hypothetical protein
MMKVVKNVVIKAGEEVKDISGIAGENVKVTVEKGGKISSAVRMEGEMFEFSVEGFTEVAEKILFVHITGGLRDFMAKMGALRSQWELGAYGAYEVAMQYKKKDIPEIEGWEGNKGAEQKEGQGIKGIVDIVKVFGAEIAGGRIEEAVKNMDQTKAKLVVNDVQELLDNNTQIRESVVGANLEKLLREKETGKEGVAAARIVMFLKGAGERILEKQYNEEHRDTMVEAKEQVRGIGQWLMRDELLLRVINANNVEISDLDRAALSVAMGKRPEARGYIAKLSERVAGDTADGRKKLTDAELYRYVVIVGEYSLDGTVTQEEKDRLLKSGAEARLLADQSQGFDRYTALRWMAYVTGDADNAVSDKAKRLWKEQWLAESYVGALENAGEGEMYAVFLEIVGIEEGRREQVNKLANILLVRLGEQSQAMAVAAELKLYDLLNGKEKLNVMKKAFSAQNMRSVLSLLGAG